MTEFDAIINLMRGGFTVVVLERREISSGPVLDAVRHEGDGPQRDVRGLPDVWIGGPTPTGG